jgi:hypothetical protein
VESHYSRASSSRLYLESVLSLYELYKNWCVDQKVKFFSVTYSLEFLMKFDLIHVQRTGKDATHKEKDELNKQKKTRKY